jgi:hypothetical protein
MNGIAWLATHPMNYQAEEVTKWRYEQLAHQIEREDSLIDKRLGWMLTFQGFLIAAFALGMTETPSNAGISDVFKYIFPTAGFTVGLLALLAVRAALSALHDLKRLWTAPPFPDNYPQPFGRQRFHQHGAMYSQGLPLAMMIAWVVIIMIMIYHDVYSSALKCRP